MFKRPGLFVLMCAMFGAAAAQPAAAGSWSICNDTSETLEVAIGYKNVQGVWMSSGWWRLAAHGGCGRVLNLRQTDTSAVYVYAETLRGGERFGGDSTFCVRNKAFTIAGDSNCRRRGYRAESFQKTIVDSYDDHTTRLKGSGSRNLLD